MSEETYRKARQAIEADLVSQDEVHPSVWWVSSLRDPDATYRVQVGRDDLYDASASWATCTCPHGLNAAGGEARCYHAAAVWLTLADRKVARDGT